MQHFNQSAVAICLAVASTFAHAQQATYDFNIPAQPASRVLDALSKQTGLQPFFAEDMVKGKQSPGVKGKFSLREALDKALAGTGLTYRFTGEKAVAIMPRAEPATTLPTVEISAKADRERSYKPASISVASKIPVSPREIPQSVSVLTRQQMDDQNMATVWDAMTQITGVQAVANDSVQGQYHARGGALNIQFDGAPSQFPLGGNQQFDLAVYERVEVLRGPAGLLQGSGSFSGTVNLVKKRPKQDPSVQLLGSLGSWNNKRFEADATGPLNEAKTVRGRLVASMTDKDWFVNRFHDKKWLVYGVVELDSSPATTWRLSATAQDDVSPGFSGLPTYTNGVLLNVDRSFNPNPTWNKTHWKNADVTAEVEHRFSDNWLGKVRVSNRGATLYFKDGYISDGVNPATNTVTYYRRIFDGGYIARDMDANISGPFEFLGRTHNLLLGANYSWYRSYNQQVTRTQVPALQVNNVLFADPAAVAEPFAPYATGSESITWQQGLYGQLRLSLAAPLTWIVGGRYSDYYTESRTAAPAVPTGMSPGANIRNYVTPYTGLVYDVNKNWTLYGSYADIFVPQTQKKVDGSVLDPRIGGQYELGAKGEFLDGKLGTSFAVFQITDKNRSYADPANPGFFLSMGEVESKGWEADIVGSPATGWDVSAGYTNLITRNTVNSTASVVGTPINTWYPRHQIKLWSNHRFGDGAWQGWNLGVGMTGMSRFSNGTTTATVVEREQAGYAVFNAQIGYRIDKTYSVSLAVNNLFDRTYFTRVQGTNTYMNYGEPRNFLLTLRASY